MVSPVQFSSSYPPLSSTTYLPKIPVIHTILTPTQGATEIPLLLQGLPRPAPPAGSEPSIGSGNYSSQRPIIAVVTGGGYDDAAFKLMYEAAKGKGRDVPWLRCDMSVPTPPLGPEYGKHMVERVKAALGKLGEEGRLDGEWVGMGGVVMF